MPALKLPFRGGSSFFGAIRYAVALSLLGRVIGYGRQVLIAYYFGVARRLDIYYMTFGIATLVVLSFSSLFDQVVVPHLVRTKEAEGDEGLRQLAGSVIIAAIAMGLLLSLIFILTIPLTSWIMAHGFRPEERAQVQHMALYFLPWTLLSIPMAALAAICKSARYYSTVLTADLLVSVVAILGFARWHHDPVALPLTFALGYAVSTTWLFVASLKFQKWGPIQVRRLKPIFRNFGELFAANQLASLSSIVGRFFQSYLRPGSISALACADQTVMVASDLLSFKELFIVPLSSVHQRREKLERLVLGLILVTIPSALFLSTESRSIIGILYQRGRFGLEAKELTAAVVSVLAINLPLGSVGLALYRMFQVIDKIRYSGVAQLVAMAATAVLAPLFLFHLKLDVVGWAWVSTLGSLATLAAEYALLRRGGLVLPLKRVGKFALYALCASVTAWLLVRWLPPIPMALWNLILRGLLYSGIVLVFYWFVRRPIEHILYGPKEAV